MWSGVSKAAMMTHEFNSAPAEPEAESVGCKAEDKGQNLPVRTNSPLFPGKKNPFNSLRRDVRLYLVGTLFAGGAGYYVYFQSSLEKFTVFSHGISLLLAFIWLILVHDNIPAAWSRINWREIRIHPAWAIVFFALMLRYYSYSIFPPLDQTGFEELEAGEIANNYLVTGSIPIGFRFTTLLAAIGLSSDSALRLFALRFPFQVLGVVSLVLLVLSLRSLKVSWAPTLLVAFIAATMRFLVIATAVADELFFGMSILTASLLFLIKSEGSKNNQPFWLSAAGAFSGILMYEYTSYRVFIIVTVFWLLWKYVAGKDGNRSLAGFNAFSFLLPLALVALPMFAHTLRHPFASELSEAFVRHAAGRSTFLPDTGLYHLWHQARALTGWTAELSSFYTPVGEPLLLPPVGWLFGISLLYALFLAGRGFPKLLGINVLLTMAGASFFANNLNIGRMAPTFPMLLVLSGIFLEQTYNKITRWMNGIGYEKDIALVAPRFTWTRRNSSAESPLIWMNTIDNPDPAPSYSRQVIINVKKLGGYLINALALLVFLALIAGVTLGNIESLRRMSQNPLVINEYANDDYSVCAHIGRFATHGQRVFIYSPFGYALCSPKASERWYVGDKQLEVRHISGEFILPASLSPGDMVVYGVSNAGLTGDEISKLADLATAAGSLDSLRFSENIAGRITAASMCFQCEK